MRITEVSQKHGISQDTIRYYERIGLLPSVNRNESGVRDFTEEDIKWIEFIKCMKSTGLSIETLIDYINLFKEGDQTLEARKDILAEQRVALVNKINELNDTLDYLDMKMSVYDERIQKRNEK